MKHTLSHESLDAYKVAVDVARWIRKTRFPHGEAALKDQARRAADSVVLNLAEGAYREGKDRHRHWRGPSGPPALRAIRACGANATLRSCSAPRIARGSAAEVCAVLDLLDFEEGPQRQQQLRRVVAMTCKLR